LFCLLLVVPAGLFGQTFDINEKEPNDDLLNARNMTNGTWYGGRAKSSDDQDWFYFKVTEGKDIDLNCTVTGLNATLYLINEENIILDRAQFNGTATNSSYNPNIIELKDTGTHFLLFSTSNIVNSLSQGYELRVKGDVALDPGEPISLSDAVLETETNNEWYDADQILAKPGENKSFKYAGDIKENDEDWFRFKVDKQSEITLKDIKVLQSDSEESAWKIKVYNDDIEIPGVNIDNIDHVGYWNQDDQKEERKIDISQGMYYLRLYDFSSHHYRDLVLNGTGLNENMMPIANGGADRSILEDREEFVLNATNSIGADVYEWEKIDLLSSQNSSIELENADTKEASFNVPDVSPPEEKFVFELKVTNSSKKLTDKDRVTITVENTHDGGGSSDGGIGCNYHPNADFGWGWVVLLLGVAVLPWARKKIAG